MNLAVSVSQSISSFHKQASLHMSLPNGQVRSSFPSHRDPRFWRSFRSKFTTESIQKYHLNTFLSSFLVRPMDNMHFSSVKPIRPPMVRICHFSISPVTCNYSESECKNVAIFAYYDELQTSNVWHNVVDLRKGFT